MKGRPAKQMPDVPSGAPPSPGTSSRRPRCGHRCAAVLLTLALPVSLAGCGFGSPSPSATTAAVAADKDALNKAWACGLSFGLDKLKALGPDGNSLLSAINATLTGRDLAANRADLLRASVEFGIDIGPPWLQCFEPFFFPDQAGAGAAPAAPAGLTIRPDPDNGTVLLLTWSNSSDNVLYFVVSDGAEERNAPVQHGTGTISYTWTGLQPGSLTCFRVRASNGDTSSNWDPNSAPGTCATTSSSQPAPASTPFSLPASSWIPIGGTTVSAPDQAGMFSATYAGTYWGGLYAAPPAGCDYRFDGMAELQPGGSGYGFGVRASVDSAGVPHSEGIQYDAGIGGYRDTLLPQDSETGKVIPASLDNGWHEISVAVFGNQYQSSVDGKVIFSGTTPLACGGVFIRIWRSTVHLRDLTVTPIT